jgi:hypothetical protein
MHHCLPRAGELGCPGGRGAPPGPAKPGGGEERQGTHSGLAVAASWAALEISQPRANPGYSPDASVAQNTQISTGTWRRSIDPFVIELGHVLSAAKRLRFLVLVGRRPSARADICRLRRSGRARRTASCVGPPLAVNVRRTRGSGREAPAPGFATAGHAPGRAHRRREAPVPGLFLSPGRQSRHDCSSRRWRCSCCPA